MLTAVHGSCAGCVADNNVYLPLICRFWYGRCPAPIRRLQNRTPHYTSCICKNKCSFMMSGQPASLPIILGGKPLNCFMPPLWSEKLEMHKIIRLLVKFKCLKSGPVLEKANMQITIRASIQWGDKFLTFLKHLAINDKSNLFEGRWGGLEPVCISHICRCTDVKSNYREDIIKILIWFFVTRSLRGIAGKNSPAESKESAQNTKRWNMFYSEYHAPIVPAST